MTKTGLYCPQGGFYIDPKRPVHKALVSHAHGDHAVPNSGIIYATAPTRSFMDRRFRHSLRSRFADISYGKSFELNDVKITFYPAGHMLGSAQILMEFSGERYLYTGDFKLQPDESCETFEFVACDYLITETTFADPSYIHPDPVNQISSLNALEKNVVIGAYAIGKSQRLTKLISRHCPEKKLLIHPDIADYHRIYEKHGRHLGEWKHYSRQEFNQETNAVLIISPSLLMRYGRNKNVLKMFATGWKRAFHRCDQVLSISDHADWQDVLSLVSHVKPKKVYTVHGDGRFLKAHFEGKSMEVIQLS